MTDPENINLTLYHISLKDFVLLKHLRVKLPNGNITNFEWDKTYIINAVNATGKVISFKDTDSQYVYVDDTIRIKELTQDNPDTSAVVDPQYSVYVYDIYDRLAQGNNITITRDNVLYVDLETGNTFKKVKISATDTKYYGDDVLITISGNNNFTIKPGEVDNQILSTTIVNGLPSAGWVTRPNWVTTNTTYADGRYVHISGTTNKINSTLSADERTITISGADTTAGILLIKPGEPEQILSTNLEGEVVWTTPPYVTTDTLYSLTNNVTTQNGQVKLILNKNSSSQNEINIVGTGATTVKSLNGKIIIDSTDNNDQYYVRPPLEAINNGKTFIITPGSNGQVLKTLKDENNELYVGWGTDYTGVDHDWNTEYSGGRFISISPLPIQHGDDAGKYTISCTLKGDTTDNVTYIDLDLLKIELTHGSVGQVIMTVPRGGGVEAKPAWRDERKYVGENVGEGVIRVQDMTPFPDPNNPLHDWLIEDGVKLHSKIYIEPGENNQVLKTKIVGTGDDGYTYQVMWDDLNTPCSIYTGIHPIIVNNSNRTIALDHIFINSASGKWLGYPRYNELTEYPTVYNNISGNGNSYVLPVLKNVPFKFYSPVTSVFGVYASSLDEPYLRADIENGVLYIPSTKGWVRISVFDDGTNLGLCLRFFRNPLARPDTSDENYDYTNLEYVEWEQQTKNGGTPLYRFHGFRKLTSGRFIEIDKDGHINNMLSGDNVTTRILDNGIISCLASGGFEYTGINPIIVNNDNHTISFDKIYVGNQSGQCLGWPDYEKLGYFTDKFTVSGIGNSYVLPVLSGVTYKFYTAAGDDKVYGTFASSIGQGNEVTALSNGIPFVPSTYGWVRISVFDEGANSGECLRFYRNPVEGSVGTPLYRFHGFRNYFGDNKHIFINEDGVISTNIHGDDKYIYLDNSGTISTNLHGDEKTIHIDDDGTIKCISAPINIDDLHFGDAASCKFGFPDYVALHADKYNTTSGIGISFLLPVLSGNVYKFYALNGDNRVFGTYAPNDGESGLREHIANGDDFLALTNGWIRLSVFDDGTNLGLCLRFYKNLGSEPQQDDFDTEEEYTAAHTAWGASRLLAGTPLYRFHNFKTYYGDNQTVFINDDGVICANVWQYRDGDHIQVDNINHVINLTGEIGTGATVYNIICTVFSGTGFGYPDYTRLSGAYGDLSGIGNSYVLPVLSGVAYKFYAEGADDRVFGTFAPDIGTANPQSYPMLNGKVFTPPTNGWVRISVFDDGSLCGHCLRFYRNAIDYENQEGLGEGETPTPHAEEVGTPLYKFHGFRQYFGDLKHIFINEDGIISTNIHSDNKYIFLSDDGLLCTNLHGDDETIQIDIDGTISYIGDGTGGGPTWNVTCSVVSGMGYPDYNALHTGELNVPSGQGMTFLVPILSGIPVKYVLSKGDENATVYAKFASAHGTGNETHTFSHGEFYTPDTNGWMKVSVIDDGTHPSGCLRLVFGENGEEEEDSSASQFNNGFPLYKFTPFASGSTFSLSSIYEYLSAGDNIKLIKNEETGITTISSCGPGNGGDGPTYNVTCTVMSSMGYPNYPKLTQADPSNISGIGISFLLPVQKGVNFKYDSNATGTFLATYSSSLGQPLMTTSLEQGKTYNKSFDGWVRISVFDDGTQEGCCLRFYYNDDTAGYPLYKFHGFNKSSGIKYTTNTPTYIEVDNTNNKINFIGTIPPGGSCNCPTYTAGSGIALGEKHDNKITINIAPPPSNDKNYVLACISGNMRWIETTLCP